MKRIAAVCVAVLLFALASCQQGDLLGMIMDDTSIKQPKLVVSHQGSALVTNIDQLHFGDALADGSGGIVGESRIVSVENQGDSDLEITLVDIDGSEDFDLDLGSLQYRLPPGASSDLTITYDPLAEGTSSGTLVLTSNDADTPDFEIDLAGQAVLAACEISVAIGASNISDGGTHDFGNVRYDGDGGSASSYAVFTVSNIGNVPLSLTTPSLSGLNSTYFDLNVSGFPTSLAAGGSANFSVCFDPLGRGTSSAVVTINNGDANENPYTINLTGKGCAPEIELLQGATVILDGGLYAPSTTVYVGATVSTTFTIKNNGDDTLHLDGSPLVTLTGDTAFSVSSQPATSVAPGASTSFTVSFRSTWADGTLEAVASFSNDDPDGSESPYNLTIRHVAERFNGYGQIPYAGYDGVAIVDYPNIYLIYGKPTAAGIYYRKSVNGGATWITTEYTIDETGQEPNVAYYTEGKTAYISYYSGSTDKNLKFATAYLGAAGDPVWTKSTPVSTGDVGIKNAVSFGKISTSNYVYLSTPDLTLGQKFKAVH
ncbi:MAG: choice-of-anchor D domain-containing protein [Spirochaetia bacterium]|nr:choice-of-anchor D domain-containing protein [Spirochaetia bacterium]